MWVVIMPEMENIGDILASENSKALKHMFKSKMKSMTEEEKQTLHG